VVVVVIVVMFLRWVDVLSHFGRVPDAIERTAKAAGDAVMGWVDQPYLGGRPANAGAGTRGGLRPPALDQ